MSFAINQATTAELKTLAEKYKLDFLVLFGSQARNTSTSQSDVDIAIHGSAVLDMEAVSMIESDLCALLQRHGIQVVDSRAISPLLAQQISNEGILLYERISGSFAAFKLLAWRMYVETAPLRKLRHEQLTALVRH